MSKNRVIIINILSMILIQGINIITVPIFSRLLGTVNYGIVSVFSTWSDMIVIAFPLSVNATLGMAQNEFSKAEQKSYQSSVFLLGLISFSLFSLIALICINIISFFHIVDKYIVYLLLINAVGNFSIGFATVRYTLDFKPQINFLISIISLIGNVGLGLLLVCIINPEVNYLGRIIGMTITSIILGVIAGIIILKEGKVYYNQKYWKFCLPLCVPVIFHTLSNIILSQSDRIMLQILKGNSITGIYSLAYSFSMILVAIYNAMNNSWVPFYYNYLHEGKKEELIRCARNYVEIFVVICVGFVLVYPEVYRIFASQAYWDGIKIIPLLVIGFFFMFLYSMSINFEFYYKKTKIMAIITVSAAILNVTLNFILIKRFHIIGAALSTALSYLFEFIIHLWYVSFVCNEEYPFSAEFYLEPLIFLGSFIIVFYVFRNYIVVRWIVGVTLGIILLFKIIKRKSII